MWQVMSDYGTLVQNINYHLSYEMRDDNMFLHFDVFNYNKSVRKEMVKDWELVKANLAASGVKHVFTYSGNKHFIKLFGGKVISVIVYRDTVAEVNAWDL